MGLHCWSGTALWAWRGSASPSILSLGPFWSHPALVCLWACPALLGGYDPPNWGLLDVSGALLEVINIRNEVLSATEHDRARQEPSGNVCSQPEARLLGHLFASSWKPHFPCFSSLKSRHPTSTTSCFPTHPVKEGNEFGLGTACSWHSL